MKNKEKQKLCNPLQCFLNRLQNYLVKIIPAMAKANFPQQQLQQHQ
jgi:hypothetical protein